MEVLLGAIRAVEVIHGPRGKTMVIHEIMHYGLAGYEYGISIMAHTGVVGSGCISADFSRYPICIAVRCSGC